MGIDLDVHDVAIIGAGIAGASLAWQLASRQQQVVLLEREAQPGYHSTGRSAAMFMESYGTAATRALTRASRRFYESPPAGFASGPILVPRGCLYIATPDQGAELRRTFDELRRTGSDVRLIDADEAIARVPVLEPQRLLGAIAEEDAQDVDVNALHQGYLRGFRQSGGQLLLSAELAAATMEGGCWLLALRDGRELRARTIVNAAGAWADEAALACGIPAIGLEPRRRTAFTFAPPEGLDIHAWPTVLAIDESFYFKPDAGQLLGSPANADPVAPHDVMAEELDVALGIHKIEEHTRLRIRRPRSTWAGLRSFVADGDLVVGRDPACDSFIWLAAQGGYGIQSAAAVSDFVASLVLREPLPQHLARQDFQPAAVDPARLR